VRDFIARIGCRAVSVDGRTIGGLNEKFDSWESVCRALEGDAGRLLAANDPRVDVEV